MDVQEAILAAFTKKARVCIHQLIDDTGLSRADLRYALVELQKAGIVRRVSEVKGDNVYELVDPKHPTVRRLPVTLGLNAATARDRVIMLKRMKARLIHEYHPILDVFLRDYERGLEAIEHEPDEDGDFVHNWSIHHV